MSALFPVVLCGGSGTRLWPCSRTLYPKQFMDLQGHTLFGDTLLRASAVPYCGAPVVVCNEEHRFYVAATLQEQGLSGTILLEPEGRNTAPAIALAAFAVLARTPEATLLILPSDHALQPLSAFATAVEVACESAAQGFLTTFGLVPDTPETGFGYIKQGVEHGAFFAVDAFIEKPNAARAAAMLADGGYLWNSGMFLFRAQAYLEALQQHAPEIFAACQAAWQGATVDADFIRPDMVAFCACPSISIDYAVMERASKVAVVPLDADWSDLGSWEAFYQIAPKDAHDNAVQGDVLMHAVTDSYIHAESRLVAALGVTGLAIIETPDAVLVAERHAVQDVKVLVAQLALADRPEVRQHRRVYRPWGSYEGLATGPGFQVKRIVVAPQASISLQRHQHRAEHWVVVSGTAEVTLDGVVSCLQPDQSAYIPCRAVHRLKNPGDADLIIIEVQSGSYLGEDDIERLEDSYGRV